MEQPTQEQIKEFWEWYGFKQNVAGGYQYPDDPEPPEGEFYVKDLPPIDLSNLFEYAVPELEKRLTAVHNIPSEGQQGVIDLLNNWIHKGMLQGEDLTLALFWALWQVKEGNNGS